MGFGSARTRRRFLAAVGTGIAGSIAGCTSILGDPTSVEWRQSVPAHDGSLAVGDGTVYVGSEDGLYVLDADSGEQRGTNPLSDDDADIRGRPAVGDGVAYYGTAGSNRAFAVDDTGSEQWHAQLDGAVIACAIDGSRVYAATGPRDGDSGLYALDIDSGDELWRRDLESNPVGSAPVVGGGRVFLQSGGLAAFDAETGDTDWRSDGGDPTDPAFSNCPAVTGSSVCCRYDRSALTVVDRGSGDEMWRAELDAVPSSPVVRDGVAYVGETDGRLFYALDVRDESTMWRAPVGRTGPFGPAVADGTVYVSGGARGNALTVLDARTGDTRWEQTFAGSLSEPVSDGERVYLSETTGVDRSVLAIRSR